ncbi:MAG: acyltransferase [Dorea sp.]|nr:acyltransferase [Dorea sp.]
MMRRLFNNIISVLHSLIRFVILKICNPQGIHFALIERFSPNVVVEVNHGGKLRLGKKVRVHSGCKLKVRNGAVMTIDDDVKVNYNCMFFCRKNIHIGSGTEFGPGVLVYDHDHDYKAGLKERKYKLSDVEIGKSCWIGANTVILRGTVIGDNCVVAAGSVVKGNIESGTVFIQRREQINRSYKEFGL